jgi:hypothetical protein
MTSPVQGIADTSMTISVVRIDCSLNPVCNWIVDYFRAVSASRGSDLEYHGRVRLLPTPVSTVKLRLSVPQMRHELLESIEVLLRWFRAVNRCTPGWLRQGWPA